MRMFSELLWFNTKKFQFTVNILLMCLCWPETRAKPCLEHCAGSLRCRALQSLDRRHRCQSPRGSRTRTGSDHAGSWTRTPPPRTCRTSARLRIYVCGPVKGFRKDKRNHSDHGRIKEAKDVSHPVLWIRDILVRNQNREFVPLTYGSGSCFYGQFLTRRQQKISFFVRSFLLIIFWRYIYNSLKR